MNYPDGMTRRDWEFLDGIEPELDENDEVIEPMTQFEIEIEKAGL